MHDVLIVSVPLITILAGLFFNRADIQNLRAEMNMRFDRIDAELRYFHGLTGKLEGRIEALEKR